LNLSAFAPKKSYWTTAPVRRRPALLAGRLGKGGDKFLVPRFYIGEPEACPL